MILVPHPIVVIKLGGSLLDWPEWPHRLTRHLKTRPAADPVMVVGGGRFADALRDLDLLHALGEHRAHALALRVLDLTAHLAAALLPDSRVVEEVTAIRPAWLSGLLPILAPRRFLEREDWESPDPLPQTWATTTDSIAARIATRLEATELVLLKSCPLPIQARDWSQAAGLGLVDPGFPHAAAGIPAIRFVNFREGDSNEGRSMRGPTSSR